MDYRFQPKGLRSNLGWYDRGYIPHFDGGEIPQFFTFRLFDSLPQTVIENWREETAAQGEEGKVIFHKNVENYLDKGYGSCFLKDERVAKLTEDSLIFHHENKYRLTAWVIMPNHIHFLTTPLENIELREISHSIKSYTAHEANKLLNRRGQFWQHEPFDRYIRNRRHFVNVIEYIENNPVKAGLCATAKDWRFSSAFHGERLERNRPGCNAAVGFSRFALIASEDACAPVKNYLQCHEKRSHKHSCVIHSNRSAPTADEQNQ